MAFGIFIMCRKNAKPPEIRHALSQLNVTRFTGLCDRRGADIPDSSLRRNVRLQSPYSRRHNHPVSQMPPAATPMRDHDLSIRLRSAAANLGDGRSISDALAVAAVAAERRLGVWKAALARPEDLSGGIRALRDAAERALKPSSANAAPRADERSDALGWLVRAMRALAVRMPSEILMPAEFYRSLSEADDAGCLAFSPARSQLDAAAHLVRGCIVEMDAGEGKSLAAALAAAVLAASGRRVHALTANGYLAARDCERHAPILESLGIGVGLIVANMDADERRYQYARQVVYAPAREIGFDYLRDGGARSFAERVNPAFDFAIADEADHLLIDQARVPLIISGEPTGEEEAGVGEDAQAAAAWMLDEQTRTLDAIYSQIAGGCADVRRALATILLGGGASDRLTAETERLGASARDALADAVRMNDEDDGRALERGLLFALRPAALSTRLTERGWEEAARRVRHPAAAFEVVQIIRAHAARRADEDYVADEGGVTLVDALDGRPLYSHRYMDGLHEALEAKEGVESGGRAPPRAMTTVRALMSNYRAVCGLSGTAAEGEDVFRSDYGARTVRVPPAAPSRRVDAPTAVFPRRADRDRALTDEVEKWHRVGRPVLLTVSTPRESADMSRALTERGVPHRVLDAANAGDEPEVVAAAGRFGAVTVSTGMAGRGTDIIPAPDADARVIAACADLALAERGETVFACASPEEASALQTALATDARANVRRRQSLDGKAEIVVRKRGDSDETVRRVEFGLGLAVLIASLPASARAERQMRGRAARQGAFGASKMILHASDPAIAFSPRRKRIMDAAPPGAAFASGAEVERALRDEREESERGRRAAALAAAEFAAVIESESRAHRAEREGMMDARLTLSQLDAAIAAWAERLCAGWNDPRADYDSVFDSVSDALWDGWRMDAAPLYGAAPAAAKRAIADAAASRALALRDAVGARRFGRLLAETRLDAADSLWASRLSDLQDMSLSAMLGSQTRREAVSNLSDWARRSRADFMARVDDALIAAVLSAEPAFPAAPKSEMDENQIERLPSELAALL